MIHPRQTYQIGVFDSGVGGLTVMQQLMRILPHENMIYFGDTARLPYGGKSRETIIRYSIENTIFLMEKNIKLLVIACNTASAFAIQKLRQIFNIPIIGVIEPGAQKAASLTTKKRIAVLGTKGTIESGAYQQELLKLIPEASIISKACPLFVPLVEEQFLQHPATQLIVQEYLASLKNQSIDTLLLGCTHYPLLKEHIQKEIGPHIHLVDSASACAEQVSLMLKHYQIESTCLDVNHQYYVSDDPCRFKEIAEKIFGHSIDKVEYSHSQFGLRQ